MEKIPFVLTNNTLQENLGKESVVMEEEMESETQMKEMQKRVRKRRYILP